MSEAPFHPTYTIFWMMGLDDKCLGTLFIQLHTLFFTTRILFHPSIHPDPTSVQVRSP